MTSQTKTKAELALELGRAMTELRVLLRQRIQAKLKEHGISLTFETLEVMACLWRQDGIIQQEIADYTLRDKSSMTYLIDKLAKCGLVKRVEDERDRRNKLIYLTPEGHTLRSRIYPWAIEVYDMASENVEEAGLKQSLSLLAAMTARLKEL